MRGTDAKRLRIMMGMLVVAIHTYGCGSTAPPPGPDELQTPDATGNDGDPSGGSDADEHMTDVRDAGASTAKPEACVNGQMRETDVDCGGPDCPKCATAAACGIALDCRSGLCSAGRCMTLDETAADGSLPDLSCTNYCTLLQEACGDSVDINGQFFDEEECMGFCVAAGWDTGATGDTGGNTLGCRVNHGGRAAETTDANRRKELCDIAGASGGGTCGSYCEVLCETHVAVCTAQNQKYESMSACLTACDGMPDSPNGTYRHADPTYLYYDTVQCRIRHLRSAVEHSASVHCPHTSELSEPGACDDSDTGTPNCSHYCDMMTKYCDGGSWNNCQAECIAAYHTPDGDGAVGAHADFSGDTLGCRINHAEFATDCDSADIDGGTRCVEGR